MPVYRIVICGQSFSTAAIEASLVAMPEVEVVRLDPRFPALLERILALQPDMVVIESNNAHDNLTRSLLSQDLPLIELNAQSDQGTLFTRHQVSLKDTQDVARLIEQIASSKV